MAKKILWITALALVAVIYYYLYRDSFARRDLAVHVSWRPRWNRPRGGPAPDEVPEMLIFTLGREYKLTGVRVIPTDGIETNKFPHPLWDLVSESNSVPLANFVYGERIRGLHAVVKGLQPEPLRPGTAYRVMVQAGSLKGQHDFTTPGEPSAAQQ